MWLWWGVVFWGCKVSKFFVGLCFKFWIRSIWDSVFRELGWDGWMASPTRWTWVWVNFGSWWWGAVIHVVAESDTTERLNWTDSRSRKYLNSLYKNLPANAGDIRDVDLIPGSGRSPGGGRGNPLQYSCLENPLGRGPWQATVHRVTESQTWLKWFSMHPCIPGLSWKVSEVYIQMRSLWTLSVYFSQGFVVAFWRMHSGLEVSQHFDDLWPKFEVIGGIHVQCIWSLN